MSESEQNTIIGQTVIELKAAEHNLACFKKKARDLATDMEDARMMLYGQQAAKSALLKYPAKEDIEEVLCGIIKETEKIESLQQTLKELGYGLEFI